VSQDLCEDNPRQLGRGEGVLPPGADSKITTSLLERRLFGRRYLVEVIGPLLQCSAHFAKVFSAIINSAYTSSVSAVVV
jgi:hypothetical protein